MSSSSPTLKSPFFWVNTSSFFTFSLQIFYFTFSLIPWPNSQLHINFISFKFKFKVNYFNLQFKVNFKIHTYLWQDSTQNSYLKIPSFPSPYRNPRERRPSQSIEKEVGWACPPQCQVSSEEIQFFLFSLSQSSRNKNRASSQSKHLSQWDWKKHRPYSL